MKNLLDGVSKAIDSHELRLLLDERIGGPGQYDGSDDTCLHLPQAGPVSRIVVRFRDQSISAIEPGVAFDASEWASVAREIDGLPAGPGKVGRDFSFSTFRVPGGWKGRLSGVQILPAPEGTPDSENEVADHPFILEFPLRTTELWNITNHRRIREHHNLTMLLNLVLGGHTTFQPTRTEHLWAYVRREGGGHDIKWVQPFFFATMGDAVIDGLSPSAGAPLEEVSPEKYYAHMGNDGLGLRVPTNLDEVICSYLYLGSEDRSRFDRATYWLSMSARQWASSTSLSFASLVSAIEALTSRGTSHVLDCPRCGTTSQHEVPGATERFRSFFETNAPGSGLARRRSMMYALRSGILHGSKLMQLDQEVVFGWDPPWQNERALHGELSGLTRMAIRNWLASRSVT